MQQTDPTLQERQSGTRAALLTAAIHLFGKAGFSGTSTREIARQAGANIASVAYHFGGKDGLRMACGQEIAREIGAVIGSAKLQSGHSPEAATAQLEAVVRTMVQFLCTSRQGADTVAFMLREMGEDGPVLGLIYEALIEPRHQDFCAIWAEATGQLAESTDVKLMIFALMGQILYFRIGRPVIKRRMGWDEIGPQEATQIADLIVRNLGAMIKEGQKP
jgi:AcrR family transcriptional regulator